jgi:hypothetical protein
MERKNGVKVGQEKRGEERTGETGGGEERRRGVGWRRLPKVRWLLHGEQSRTVYWILVSHIILVLYVMR